MQRDRSVTALQALEPRTLRAANLSLFEATTTAGSTFAPGDTVPLTVIIQNTGDQHVFGAFEVAFRLARTDAFNLVPGNYNDPGAVSATIFPVDGGVNVGAFHEEQVPLKIPAGIAAGTYSVTAFVDSTNKIPENDNNNNVSTTALSLLVIGADGIAVLDGTAGGERIDLSTVLTSDGPAVTIRHNGGAPKVLSAALVDGVLLRTLGGNDTVVVGGGITTMTIDGGDGNDKIVGGLTNETLVGGAGKDTLFGGGGNDRLNGNGGNDRLFGEAGSDRLYGYAGNDILDGGSSSDRLEGGDGVDVIYGQGGNDKFFCTDTLVDQLFGGSGTDNAFCDDSDVRSSIESHQVA